MLTRNLPIFLVFAILLGACGGNGVVKPEDRVAKRVAGKNMIRLGSLRSEVIERLGHPNKISPYSDLGTFYDYGNCGIWFNDEIVTNIFCQDIPISTEDITNKATEFQ